MSIEEHISEILEQIQEIIPIFKRQLSNFDEAPPLKFPKNVHEDRCNPNGVFNESRMRDDTYRFRRCRNTNIPLKPSNGGLDNTLSTGTTNITSNVRNVKSNNGEKIEDVSRATPSIKISELDDKYPTKTEEIVRLRSKIESIPVCQESFLKELEERYPKQQQQISQLEEQIQLRHDFPKLSKRQMLTINNAIKPEETDEETDANNQIITNFHITIIRADIRLLQPTLWLNDKLINFYMSLLNQRSDLRLKDGYPKVYAMKTYFKETLCRLGYDDVSIYTQDVDIFDYDIILVPVNIRSNHWLNSITDDYDVLSTLETYLQRESLDKRKIELKTGWSKEYVIDHPQQTNGDDCGVFSCMTAEFISRNRPIVFSQKDMDYFRNRMALEICEGKMMV